MKDDYSKLEKHTSNLNQSDNSSSVNDDSLDWAKQAYLQLKQKQKEEKEIRAKEIEEKEALDKKNIKNTIKNNVDEAFSSNIPFSNKLEINQYK